LAKALGARVIAGGCFFGQVAPQVLSTRLVDVVVHGEGEQTLVEVVQGILQEGHSRALAQVRGISFLEGEQTRTTSSRPLIANLDDLPMPAFDLLPMERYGANSRNHPRLGALELSRGCFGSCDFCVLWRQMGRFNGERVVPQLRTKSVERLLEEVRILVRAHHRGYLGWVDPCFNADPSVPGELGERMLSEGLAVGQSAWVRTDALVRDAHSGALSSCVRAGLNEVYLGIERAGDDDLISLRKTSGVEDARQALSVLRSRFPEVLTVGSFIYGLPGDTPRHVQAIHRLAIDLGLDQFFFIPLTPLPGTSSWRDDLWDPSGTAFRDYNFLPSGKPHGHHAELERALLWSLLFTWPRGRVRAYWRKFSGGDPRRRRISRRLAWRGAMFHVRRLLNRALGVTDGSGMVFPKWYET
jgi:anaerobic magnesium-protoporphyrin IX monomethyl ester cyclase